MSDIDAGDQLMDSESIWSFGRSICTVETQTRGWRDGLLDKGTRTTWLAPTLCRSDGAT